MEVKSIIYTAGMGLVTFFGGFTVNSVHDTTKENKANQVKFEKETNNKFIELEKVQNKEWKEIDAKTDTTNSHLKDTNHQLRTLSSNQNKIIELLSNFQEEQKEMKEAINRIEYRQRND